MILALKAKIFSLGEWYSCRGTALLANSEVSTLWLNAFITAWGYVDSL